ncbi:plasmid mobilization protein [Arcticibacter sp.]|uniref:plasmid mobilization protein n=1 Tax=Arcticibacter sp. TaxID=1872630 RepID=UPI003890BA56
MPNDKINREKWLHLRLTEDELSSIRLAFSKTTQRKMSDYARKILLGKPIVATYRNSSLDELMNELISLKKDLNGIANNFNQAVHKLHTLDHLTQFDEWLCRHEELRKLLFSKIEEIRLVMLKLGEEWLR